MQDGLRTLEGLKMTVQQLKCPTCGRATPVSQAKHLPFCSDRCRLIDLGRWLDEEHAVPAAAEDEDDSTPQSVPSVEERPPVRLPPGWHDA